MLSSTDREEPNLDMPSKDKAEPMRAKLRKDNEEPK